jgi:hypothetical protein
MSTRGLSLAAMGLAVAGIAACSNNNQNISAPAEALGNPDSLTYLLLPGAPDAPNGILLSWAPATDPNVTNYVVFAATVDTSADFGELGTTISTSFHQAGTPLPFFFVASEDQFGDISSGTPVITVDTAPPLPPPGTVTAAGFDSASEVTWSANARLQNPSLFAYYRVYSEPAAVSGMSATCGTPGPGFAVEGSTVSEDFVVTGLANGTTWCYAITTVTQDGHESVLSSWATDTPTLAAGPFAASMGPRATIIRHNPKPLQRAVVARR